MMQTVSAITLFSVLATLAAGAPLEAEQVHKLSLRKIPDIRDGEHPHMAFQRHQNAALKRLHRFTGREVPSEEYFEERTQFRKRAIELSDRNLESLEKRLWYPPAAPTNNVLQDTDVTVNEDFGISGSVGIIPTGSSGDSSSPGNNAAAAPTTTITAGGSNKNGFDQAEEDALENGTVMKSTSNLIQGGLAYDIEYNDVGYLADVQIGTPAKDFTFLMDTGSGDTWVPGEQCGNSCGGHQSLGSSSSSSFQGSNDGFQTSYGSGAVKGTLCSDDMSIAGMQLKNHQFGVSTQETSQFGSSSVPFDGLMGLSFSSLSNQGVSTPIESLANNGLVKNAILGIALGRVADGSNDGELVFGQADSSKFDASTTQTLPVSSNNGFWQVDLGAVQVNGKNAVTGRQAILDTGTSLMVAPTADANAFHQQIEGAQSLGNGMFSVPCTTNAQVFMNFGNAAFQVDVRDLLFQPTGQSLTGDCVSSLSAGTVTDDQTWLLGDAFLKNVYMTTNVGAKTVQLSARTDSPLSSSAGKSNSAAVVQKAQDNAMTGSAARRSHMKRGGRAGLLTAGGLAAYFARMGF